MQESTQQHRAMRPMDWFVVALVVGALIFPFFYASADVDRRQIIERAANVLAAVGCVGLLCWMWLADGAHSCLWRWLPPFWPWSLVLTTPLPRHCLVALLVLGTVLGILSSR
jgi:hypothetical protein